MSANADDLKAAISLERVIELDGIKLQRSGPNKVCRCPFHEERSASFTIYPDNHFVCFGCGVRGDHFDYLQQRRGIAFHEAKAVLSELAGHAPVMAQKRPSARRAPLAPVMTAPDVHRALRMVDALFTDDQVIEQVAEWRGWLPATIKQVAGEAALGWYQGKLAFIYPTGVKLRWMQNGERRLKWEIGQPSLWRGEIVSPRHARVYVTEGETDAISLVDAGAETDGKAIATALPSATTCRPEWFEAMRGKDIVITPDADAPGQRAAQRINEACASAGARSIKIVDVTDL